MVRLMSGSEERRSVMNERSGLGSYDASLVSRNDDASTEARLLEPGQYHWPDGLRVSELREEQGWFEDRPVRHVMVLIDPETPASLRRFGQLVDVSREIRDSFFNAGVDGIVDVHFVTETELRERDLPVDDDDEAGREAGAA